MTLVKRTLNKDQTIDAIQFIGLNDQQEPQFSEYPDWLQKFYNDKIKVFKGKCYVTAHTSKNLFMSDECHPTDWILHRPELNSIWMCSDETFKALYTKV